MCAANFPLPFPVVSGRLCLALRNHAVGLFTLGNFHEQRVAVRAFRHGVPRIVSRRRLRFNALLSGRAVEGDQLDALGFQAAVVLGVTLHQGGGGHVVSP